MPQSPGLEMRMRGVYQGADGDKKQGHKASRKGDSLSSILCVVPDSLTIKTSQKCSQRKRQSDRLGNRSRGETQCQHDQYIQFVASRPFDPFHHGWHQLRGHKHYGSQDQQRLAHRNPQGKKVASGEIGQEGSSTVKTTTARSSTRVIPIITLPCGERNSPRSASKRESTMVLATETMAPGDTLDQAPPQQPSRADAQSKREQYSKRPAENRDPLHLPKLVE